MHTGEITPSGFAVILAPLSAVFCERFRQGIRDRCLFRQACLEPRLWLIFCVFRGVMLAYISKKGEEHNNVL